jgi:hypothetical protein
MLPVRGTGNAKSRIEMVMGFIATFTLYRQNIYGFRQLKFTGQAALQPVTLGQHGFQE